ncbi:MAG TPA: hypothetical protein VJ957_04020 [Longimicrobiales bacterium]|nr:hypothetical protein [Longimicrobiales bacterium]
MSRSFQDPDLLVWETYGTNGAHGAPDHAHIMFHCVSDPSRRARYVTRDGSVAAAEKAVSELSQKELLRLFHEARPIK